MNRDSAIIDYCRQSDIYRDYERAFSDATELPLSLRPAEFWQLADHGKSRENPFCALMAKTSKSCAACLRIQEEIGRAAGTGRSATMTCFAGLSDTAVPVFLGERAIGFLQTGQVALSRLSQSRFQEIARQIIEWGSKIDLTEAKEAYFHSRVLSERQYTAMIRLLESFARHLSLIANQIAIQEDEQEPPLVRRARAYIAGHHADAVTLDQVANAMHVSTYYFCKMFKKATGLTFTDYLGRVRIEKAKNLLLNPHLRVSEIAYDIGFQSLTHFNRVFKQVAGESPTRYRRGTVTKGAFRATRAKGLDVALASRP
jgi:AraC-like DNA-binding protein/ligand-binding sensor protein